MTAPAACPCPQGLPDPGLDAHPSCRPGGLRILLVDKTLGWRGGAQLYLHDVARALLRLGHTPIAYSPVLGDLADVLRRATVPVIDDLDKLSLPPDVIHGQHTLETLSALLRFPDVPAVYFCHGWNGWNLAPLRFPRIHRFVAVDDTCRDRLLYEHGIPADRLHVLLNFVDLEQFRPRGPLPPRPARALAFGNDIRPGDLEVLAAACARQGLPLDAFGRGIGREDPAPHEFLSHYDLVFAKARCALEAMAVGTAVVLFGANGLGPLVTTGEFDRLRRLNFGVRSQDQPLQAERIVEQIGRYDDRDAQAVSARIRAEADKDRAVEEIVRVYRLTIQDQAQAPGDPDAERSQAAAYLRQAAPVFYAAHQAQKEVQALRKKTQDLRQETQTLRKETENLRQRVALLAAERNRACADLARIRGLPVVRQGAAVRRWLRRLRSGRRAA